MDPKDETPFLGLGLSFHGIGKYTEAHKWIKSSLDLNPENVSAIYSLLKASHKLNRYDEIISVIERYLAIHKQDHNLIFTLASLFFVQKRYKDSKKLIGILLEFKPEDRRTLDLLNKINSISEDSQFVSS